MKRLFRNSLFFVLALILVGCQVSSKQDFDSFVKDLPSALVGDNAFDLNYSFYDASKFGIKKKEGNIEIASNKEYSKMYDEIKELKDKLEKYDYDSLNGKQKADYDTLEDYLKRQLLLKDFVSYENSYLGSFIGYQAQLPFLLMEFEINDKTDLNTYLNVLKKSPDTFKKMVNLEKERQKNNTGLSKVLLNGVIEQANNFSNGNVNFLIDTMNTKIANATFLTTKEKNAAKKSNEKYTKENLVNAYKTLAKELKTIKPTKKDGGIYKQTNSKKYYEALFQSSTGIDLNIKQLKSYLSDKKSEIYKSYMGKLYRNPDLASSNLEKINHGTFKSVEDNISYLVKNYSKHFPKIEEVSYKVKKVPASLKDNFSPAAYLTSRVDRKTQPLVIIVNGDYNEKTFDTIAHEGYPGHMYQDCYFQTKDVSTFRKLISCKGYSEGWATYIEQNDASFTKKDNVEELELLNDNSKLLGLLYCTWDIGINYDGMTRSEFKKDVTTYLGDLDDDTINNTYTTIMETPTNYLQYYVTSFYFNDMYQKAQSELGDKFDEKEFHRVILDLGSTGLNVVGKYVDKYIEEKGSN